MTIEAIPMETATLTEETEIESQPNFGLLRKRTKLILQRLLEGGQGLKNISLDSRPLGRLFTLKEVEKMTSKTDTTLKKYIKQIQSKIADGAYIGKALPPLEFNEKRTRIIGYPFSWVQALRKEANTLPWRHPDFDDPFILAVSQFKGGVGKTEVVANFARYLAMRGYRVLVIDMDHQASCTGSFGVFPDMMFTEQDTVIPYIRGDEDDLSYAIKKTAWPNIDLIPGCLQLESFNWSLAKAAMECTSAQETKDLYEELKIGIGTVSGNYDIVLIDSPPSSSISSFEILAAADGIVVPLPPRKHDLASTEQFLGIAERLFGTVVVNDDGEEVEEEGILADKEFKFLRFLITQFTNEKPRSTNDIDFFNICRKIYGSLCYEKVFRTISNIKEASREFTTVYEVEKPNKAILKELDAMFAQIETDILRHWPSKQKQLSAAAFGA